MQLNQIWLSVNAVPAGDRPEPVISSFFYGKQRWNKDKVNQQYGKDAYP